MCLTTFTTSGFCAVTSYVGSGDVDLAQEIKQVVQSGGQRSFATIFSRNKMLRRKIKRRSLSKKSQ